MIATDISPFAVASARKWERLFSVRLDVAFTCRSHAIPMRADSLNLFFSLSAVHHFFAYRRTEDEIHLVLKPGGARASTGTSPPVIDCGIRRPALG